MQKTPKTIIYLGVDIGKTCHAWTLVSQDGHILEEGTVLNKPARLNTFAKGLVKRFDALLLGCEATGSYYENIAIAFSSCNVPVRVINPALTSTKALRSSMRMTKTDKQDARGIARKLQEKQGEIGTVFQWNPEERRLQAMGRHLRFLKKQRTSLQIRVQDIQSRPFEMFNVDVHIFDEEIARLEHALKQEADRLYETAMKNLVAIRGVGEKSAAMILAETMCLKRFPTSKAFAAFVGLDPTVKQSGTSINGKSRMSKAGSPHLRASLTWNAKLLVRWNDTFRELFENALSRGKAPGVAYGIVARKFATVVHQCITNSEAFDPTKVGLGTRHKSLTL
jgi:transposase